MKAYIHACTNAFNALQPQASATSVTRTLAAVTGKKASAEKNPEDYTEKLFKKKGLSLPISVEMIQHPIGQSEIRTWYVSPQSWVAYLLATSPQVLTGDGDLEQNLRSFWWAYRVSHPHHAVYHSARASELEHTLPVLIHGDEGRGLKKGKCMVMSFQSPLGATRKPKSRDTCSCGTTLAARPDLPQFGAPDEPDAYCMSEEMQGTLKHQTTNYCGHTYLSRWLLFSLGSWIYLKHPEVLDVLVARVACDMKDLCENGVVVAGRRVYAACLGVKGDLDWHRQVYNLLRSYAHVGTKSTGSICHACLAGGNGPMFEDYSENPTWANTAFVQRPWDTNAAPPYLCQIPSFPAPEELIQLDPFHVVKMGVGRSIAGGVLVFLVRQKYFDHPGSSQNFKERLERAHSNFSLYCSSQRKYPSLRSFTKAFLNMKSLASAPWTATKGADTMLMLQWLLFYLGLMLQGSPEPAHVPILRDMQALCKACVAAMSMMHMHGLWMERACGRLLYIQLMRTLRGYQLLGSKCLNMGYRAFIQKPKNHALHHIAWKIREQLLFGAPLILNPEAFSCEPDEDFIGRISRLSRKLDVRKQGSRVFSRMFLKVRALRRRFQASK